MRSALGLGAGSAALAAVAVLFWVGIRPAADARAAPDAKRIEGRISPGASLPDASLGRVRLRFVPEGVSTGPVEVDVDRDGEWAVPDVGAAAYTVRVVRVELRGRGGRGLEPEDLVVSPFRFAVEDPGVPVGLLLELAPGQETLVVRVRTASGAPVAGARVLVEIRRPRHERSWSVVTDGDGRAVLRELVPGTYRTSVTETPPFVGLERVPGPGGVRDVRRTVRVPGAEGGPGVAEIVLRETGGLDVTVDRADVPDDVRLRVDLQRREADGTWRWRSPNPRPVPERLATGPGEPVRERHALRRLAPGRYRIGIAAPGRLTIGREIDVRVREVARVSMSAGPPGPGVTFAFTSPFREEERPHERFNLNRRDDSWPVDVAGGMFTPGERRMERGALRPGAYVLILWDRNLARLVDLRAPGPWNLEVDPPAAVPPGRGTGVVTVNVRRRKGTRRSLIVGLAPAGPGPRLANGAWMRYAELGRTPRFAGLPAGRYDVAVLDGVFGPSDGLGVEPIMRTVEVDDAEVEVDFDL